MPPDAFWLAHMLDAARRLEGLHGRFGERAFLESRDAQDMFCWKFAVLGEAAKGISAELRANHQEVPWREIAGMRDVLVHGYFRISHARIWETTAREIPAIVPLLEAIANSLSPEEPA